MKYILIDIGKSPVSSFLKNIILINVIKNKETDVIIKTDTYRYENEELINKLTSYNNQAITNSRQLKSYTDSSNNLNVSYELLTIYNLEIIMFKRV